RSAQRPGSALPGTRLDVVHHHRQGRRPPRLSPPASAALGSLPRPSPRAEAPPARPGGSGRGDWSGRGRTAVEIALFMTLPGLVIVLMGVAFVDRVLLRWWRGGPRGGVSATGFEMLHASLLPGKEHELRQRETMTLLREEEGDG